MSHPDADLHPVATGPAKTIVDAHQAEQDLKLYAGWFCPFVQRTWTVLEEKKIPYQYIEVNPYHKPRSLLSLNPRGLVPTLSVPTPSGPRPLYESTVIGEYLEEAFADHAPRLLPEDSYDRARARIWIDFCASRIVPSYHRFLQSQAGGEELDRLREEFLGHWKTFVREMDAEGPYFGGGGVGMVDLMVAPWAVRLWVFDHFKGGLGIPEPGKGGEDEQVWSRWRKWYEAVSDRPSVKDTTSEREHYLPIYQRYAEDRAQSEMAKATRKGHGVP